MEKLLGFLGATIGGTIGWAIGMKVGYVTAFCLSMVGTGFGIYYARKLGRTYL